MTTLARFRAATKRIKTSTSIALWLCLFASISLLIASFIVPPMGVIDSSVLRAASLIFGFAALFVAREAIMEGLGVKLTHGETTFEIKDQGGQPAEAIEADGDPGRQE